MKLILDPLFEHLLVTDSCLDRIASRTSLLPPS